MNLFTSSLLPYLDNAWRYFSPGGGIMGILVLCSLWMWALIVDRLYAFRRMGKENIGITAAATLMTSGQAAPSAGGGTRTLVLDFLAARSGHRDLDQRILEQLAMAQLRPLGRFLSTISALAAAAPLLGLLGTVMGMVSTFDTITWLGACNAKALSDGISKAMTTTQGGLLVGIPGLLMGRLLSRRSQSLARQLNCTVIALKRMV